MATETVGLMIPEIAIIMIATWAYLGSTFFTAKVGWSVFAAFGLIVAGFHLQQQSFWLGHGHLIFSPNGPILFDYLSYGVRWLTLGIGFLFVLINCRSAANNQTGEVVGSMLMMLLGVMLIASANELVMIFLGLEMISIPTYILLFLGRNNHGSKEATAKYFFLSILASAILLYGFSFLYGLGGSTNLTAIANVENRSAELNNTVLLQIAMVLIFTGVGFKIAAVPFHFYAPDVYQGTSSVNAGLLSVIPKIGGIVLLARLTMVFSPGVSDMGWYLVLAVAALTMTLGNVVALWQKNIRRMLAYSSIAHAGYMLMGLAVALAASLYSNDPQVAGSGLHSMLFYLVVYAIATVGSFAVLTYFGDPEKQVNQLDELAGVGRNHPVAAASMAIFMFSLAGIPPLAGFWGKFSLFNAALKIDGGQQAERLHIWFIGLAIIGAVNAAIAAAYYLRVVAVMFFQNSEKEFKAKGGTGALVASVMCAVIVVGVGVAPNLLNKPTTKATDNLTATKKSPQIQPQKRLSQRPE